MLRRVKEERVPAQSPASGKEEQPLRGGKKGNHLGGKPRSRTLPRPRWPRVKGVVDSANRGKGGRREAVSERREGKDPSPFPPFEDRLAAIEVSV